MNFIVNGVRAVVFGFHMQVFLLRPKVLTLVLPDLPGTLFFSTYTLLVMFWAEIYHQICFWIYIWLNDNSTVQTVLKIFIAAVSFLASLGFALYGGSSPSCQKGEDRNFMRLDLLQLYASHVSP